MENNKRRKEDKKGNPDNSTQLSWEMRRVFLENPHEGREKQVKKTRVETKWLSLKTDNIGWIETILIRLPVFIDLWCLESVLEHFFPKSIKSKDGYDNIVGKTAVNRNIHMKGERYT